MKRYRPAYFALLIAIILLTSLALAACEGKNDTYAVIFDVDGADYRTVSVKSGGTVELPAAPVKSGNNFENWYFDKDTWTIPFTAATPITADTRIYARFVPAPVDGAVYTVTFDSNGGSPVAPMSVTVGKSFTLPNNPVLAGHSFVGWFTDNRTFNNHFTASYKVAGSMTVYAKWAAIDNTGYFEMTGSVLTKLTALGKAATTVEIPAVYQGVTVTEVGAGLFKGAKGLTAVTVKSGIISIGAEAFSGCTALETLTLGGTLTSVGAKAFYGCTALKNVRIPDKVTAIGDECFRDCNKLATLNMTSVKSVGSYAFSGTALTTLTIPAATETIGNYAFNRLALTTLNFSKDNSQLSRIGDYAFGNCTAITSVDLPDNLTAIGAHAFENCTGLTALTLGAATATVGDYAFYNCEKLPSLNLSSSVRSVGAYAFYSNKALAALTIAEGLETIGSSAFQYCFKLLSLTLPDSLKAIGASAFLGAGLTSISIPEQVTNIPDSAFNGCESLASVTIEGTVTKLGSNSFAATAITGFDFTGIQTLGNGVFQHCKKLSGVNFSGSAITDLPQDTFIGCTSLAWVNLGNIRTIGQYAFKDCAALPRFDITDKVTSINSEAFIGCRGIAEFVASASSTYFATADGVLYNKNFDKLVAYPLAKTSTSFTLPETVAAIGAHAFYGNTHITNFDFSDAENLSVIYPYAFAGATGFTALSVPESVVTVGAYAFSANKDTAVITVPYSAFELTASPLLDWKTSWFVSSKTSGGSSVSYPAAYTDLGYSFRIGDDGATLLSYSGSDTVIDVPVTVMAGGTTYNVVALAGTFKNNTTLITVNVPASVEVISAGTFEGCTALKELSLPFVGGYSGATGVSGLFGYIFNYRSASGTGLTRQYYSDSASVYCAIPAVEKVTVGGGGLSYGAFYGCSQINHVVLGAATTIPARAFWNCSALLTFTLGDSSALTKIESYAFYNCANMTAFSAGALTALTEIGAYAFYESRKLTAIDFSQAAALVTIGETAFYNTGLTEVSFAASTLLSSIGSQAFYSSDELASFTFPATVTTLEIGVSAFSNCAKLETLTLPGGAVTVKESAFYRCSSLISVWFNGVTSIGEASFRECAALINLYFSNSSALAIGKSAFSGCTALTSLTFPSSAVTLGESAFSGCAALSEINFGGTTSIGKYCFENCSSENFGSVAIPASVITVGIGAFKNANGTLTIVVPFASGNRPAGWNASWNSSDHTVQYNP